MSGDYQIPLLFREIDVFSRHTRLLDAVCIVLFILGIFGNLLGLFIFTSSRRSRRISSVYVFLATSSSVTNLLSIIRYTSILHSTTRYLLRQLIGQNWWACKFFEFSFSFRVISSWITLFWMFERLVCVSKRLRSYLNRWCSCKQKFLIPIIIIILIVGCVIGPSVYLFQPDLVANNDTMNLTMNITNRYCGLNWNTPIQRQSYFYEVHLGINHYTVRCLFSELLPPGIVILFNSYIIYHVIRKYRHLHQTYGHRPLRGQSRTTSWMNTVLILHSLLFLLSILAHLIAHWTVGEAHETWWVLLSVLINCSINFYIYCLSGEAFRNEIRRLLQCCKTKCLNKCQTRRL